MESVKHTPGPWFVHDGIVPAPKEEKGYVGTYEVLNMEAYEADVKVIGNVIPYGGKNYPDRSTAHANAKLIVSAPDLLLACIEAQKHLRDKGYGPLDTVYACLINAIEKATT